MKVSSIFEAKSKVEADAWVRGWTYSSDSEKSNITGAEIAYEVYGYKPRRTLYRGMSFDTKEDFEKFKHATSNFSILNEKSLSSWTEDKAQAAAFAMIDDEYDDSGYGGIVLAFKLSQNLDAKIINARKSTEGENEAILFPGKYSVSLSMEKIHKGEK